jgi:hypothetical protein
MDAAKPRQKAKDHIDDSCSCRHWDMSLVSPPLDRLNRPEKSMRTRTDRRHAPVAAPSVVGAEGLDGAVEGADLRLNFSFWVLMNSR